MRGGPKPKARTAYERVCSAGNTGFGALACGYLSRYYGSKKRDNRRATIGLSKRMLPQSKGGVARGCGFVGVTCAIERGPDAPTIPKKACRLGDLWTCLVAKRPYV